MLFSFYLLKMIQAPAAVALVLCIIGATSANNPAQISSQTTFHIGIILFAVVLFGLIILTLGAAVGWRTTQRGEGALIVSVALALPFLVVRIVYSILVAFSHNPRFGIVNENYTINLVMEVLPEAVVVLIYICCGMKLQSIRKPTSQTAV
jgi:hypothetical protein